MSLPEASQAWIFWMETERGLLPSTINGYRREMRMLWTQHRERVPDLTAEDLRTYLAEAGGKASTVAGRIAAFRSFYGFLVRTDRRLDDPTAKLDRPKVRRGLPKPIENRALILAALSPRMRLVAMVLAETGLRISEACSLDVGVPCPSEIVVRGKGAKERVVLFTPKARAAMDDMGGRLLFRKPGENAEPIKTDVTNEEWILWARPIWYSIRESETLQARAARTEKDEKHIAPLQLGTIERCIRLWSNVGDLILDPMAGIGSTGFVALRHLRRFVGIELKPEYYAQAAKNLESATSQMTLAVEAE